jgi:hypothetical protein
MTDDRAERGRVDAEHGRVRAEGAREFAERGDEESRVLNEEGRVAAEDQRRGSWVHRYNGAILGTLIAAVVALALLCGYLVHVQDDQAQDIEDAAVVRDAKLKEAAADRRRQIIRAGERAVALICRDVNLQRREQRRTIREGRSRLRALATGGDISRGLYRTALEQGNRRLLRLAPIDCVARAAVFRETALNGR